MWADRVIKDHTNRCVFVSNYADGYTLYEAKLVAEKLSYSFYIVETDADVKRIKGVLSEG